MKLRIIIGLLLAALICELVWLSGMLQEEYDAAMADYRQQSVLIEERTLEVDALQQELDALNTDEADALEAQAKQMEEQAAQMDAQLDTIRAQTEELNATVEEKQPEFEEIEEDYNYFMGVYKELEEGLEKVKGYISGN